ncbi:MAG: EAL domain-containing protein [Eubacterium sp.]|nr:EAL domain-containing protein [Eubacterium sp.]
MTEIEKKQMDELFSAFSIVAEGAYVFLCNMKYDYSRWSKTAVDYFGLPGEYMENAGGIWIEHIHPDDREDYKKSIERIFSGEDQGHDMQYRSKAVDGSYVVCTCRGIVMKAPNGEALYFGGAIKNHGLLSYIDNNTGLRSLYGFFEDLRTMFWRKDEGNIIQIGISNFSAFNDIYGYSFGNRILQTFARLLQTKFANVGSIYRMDGTKFAIITHSMDQYEIEKRYNELKDIVSGKFYVDDERINLSINAGNVLVNDFEISDKTVYSCLKYAYYRSKNDHLGELYTFVDALNDDGRKVVQKLDHIRSSVNDECEGFYLCYQPVMHADTCKLKGAEALIRWKDDVYGVVPPMEFIPYLEQDSIFPLLGKWILKQAMTDGVKFLEKYPEMIMNVNLSYAQLEKEGFVEEVFSIIEETGFPADHLCLEITERCRLIDTHLLYDIINIFRDYGIKVALDDFGTGFSTLGILRDVPVDVVKIEREYVKNIETSKIDQATVENIADLAGIFDADVCVEGVETKGMVEMLNKFKVSSLQGYYFSKPIPFDEFMAKDFD